jgi:hypothetical protein
LNEYWGSGSLRERERRKKRRGMKCRGERRGEVFERKKNKARPTRHVLVEIDRRKE